MGLFSSEIISTPQIQGVSNGSAANTGFIGEYVSSLIAVGSAVSLTTATPKNITSISLTAGDWDVEGNINLNATSATVASGSLWVGGINTTSATIPTTGAEVQESIPTVTTTSFKTSIATPPQRISITTTTTVYLVAEATFTAGTVTGYGILGARRVR